MVNKIILASASPRRKDLLKQAGIDFIVDASSIDEVLDEFSFEESAEIIKALLEKRRVNLSCEKEKRRAIARLQREGYSFEDIKTAINDLKED